MSVLALMLPACTQQHRAGSNAWCIVCAGYAEGEAGHVWGRPVPALEEGKPGYVGRKRRRDEKVSQAV